MQGLTKRQREILDYIESYIMTHRYAPSFKEIAEAFHFSSLGSVYGHIKALEKKKALSKLGHKARSLSLPQVETPSFDYPLVGKIKGGMPIETYVKIKTVSLPLLFEEQCYLLQVEGEGLIEELMLPNDLLLVDPRSHFDEGELVIASIETHTTLIKRCYSEPPYFRFESATPALKAEVFREDHVSIQGVVLTLLRDYHL